jgi:putative NADPH-quinone reductase/1,4-dihydroxy-2-naphthoate octaprenyltransferase
LLVQRPAVNFVAMNILVILGHPRKESFCSALADAYIAGAEASGAAIKYLKLTDMEFSLHVTNPHINSQTIEPDLLLARNYILWAQHLVFIYPTWWSTMPSLLKGFLDRVLTPGFAFEERTHKYEWEKLLKGRSAQLITTLDTPLWVYQWIYKAPGKHAMKIGILGYCGISPVRSLAFSSIKYSTASQRSRWLERTRKEGQKAEKGILTVWEKQGIWISSWLKAIRLQFYPMTWVAYAIGAFGAAYTGYLFDGTIFWVGYIFLFFLEVATVLTNDYYDFHSDKNNHNYSAFTGGSRVLVEKLLTPKQLKRGVFFSLAGMLLCSVFILMLSNGSILTNILLMILMAIMALGYTVPPLKLCYRGLGELDVGLTHSVGVMLCGFAFQGAPLSNPFPWLMSLPLFLSIIPAIILAGIPDYEADKAVKKKTAAVMLGKRKAAMLAITFIILALIVGICWKLITPVKSLYNDIFFIIIPHGIAIIVLVLLFLKKKTLPPRIDFIMILSLLFIFWYGIVPLVALI